MKRKQWIVLGVIAALIAIPVVLKLSRGDTNKIGRRRARLPARADSDRARIGIADL